MKIHPVSSAILFIVIAVLALAVAHGNRLAAVEVRIEHNYNIHLQVEIDEGPVDCGAYNPLVGGCDSPGVICPDWQGPAPYIQPGYKTLSLDDDSSQVW